MLDDEVQLSMRTQRSLDSLKRTHTLMEGVQKRLNTGLRVNAIADDPVSYFRARSLNNRTQIFKERKDTIDQALSTLDTSLSGVDSLQKLLQQMKGAVNNMKEASTEQEYHAQLDTVEDLMEQYDKLARDVSYGGVNLLVSSRERLEVQFSEVDERRITIEGIHLLATRVLLPPTEEKKTPFYNPLLDETLLDALRNRSELFFGLREIEGYSRLLGFGFSLFCQAGNPLGYKSMVDQYIGAIGGAQKAGSIGKAVLERSFLELLEYARMGAGHGLGNLHSVVGTAASGFYRHGYEVLRLLGFAGADFAGALTNMTRRRIKLDEFLDLVTGRPTGIKALDMQDHALLKIVLNGQESRVSPSLFAASFMSFLKQLYPISVLINAQSLYLVVRGLLRDFTYHKVTMDYEDWQRLQGVFHRLQFLTNFATFSGIMKPVSRWADKLLSGFSYLQYMRFLHGVLTGALVSIAFSRLRQSDFRDFMHYFTHKPDEKIYINGRDVFTIIAKILSATAHFTDYFHYENPFTVPSRIAAMIGGALPNPMSLFFRTVFSAGFYNTNGALKASGYVVLAQRPTILLRTGAASVHLPLSRLFSAQAGLVFRTDILRYLPPSDARHVKDVMREIFKNRGLDILPLGKDLRLDNRILLYQREIFQSLVAHITVYSKQVSLSLKDLTKDTRFGEGTTAIGLALEWLNNIHFENIYQSGELSKEVDIAVDNLDIAIRRLEGALQRFGEVVNVLEIRYDFTETYAQTMEMGAGKLVLADTTEEGAKLMSLQTRSDMNFKMLSIAGQQASSYIDLLQY